MRISAFVYVSLLMMLFSYATAQEPDANSGIDGTWVLDSFVLDGEPVGKKILDRLKKTPYRIKDGKFIIGDGGTIISIDPSPAIDIGLPIAARASTGMTILFDDSKTPGVVTGTNPAYDGWHGIFKVENGKLIVCRCSADVPVPTEFKSSAEKGWQLRTYVRKHAVEFEDRD